MGVFWLALTELQTVDLAKGLVSPGMRAKALRLLVAPGEDIKRARRPLAKTPKKKTRGRS